MHSSAVRCAIRCRVFFVNLNMIAPHLWRMTPNAFRMNAELVAHSDAKIARNVCIVIAMCTFYSSVFVRHCFFVMLFFHNVLFVLWEKHLKRG